MKIYKIQFKIFISTVLCVMLVSLLGTMYLFQYINNLIYEKSRHIDEIYLNTVSEQINSYLDNSIELGMRCANDTSIIRALNTSSPDNSRSKVHSINAQKQLNAYLDSFIAYAYVDKLIAFNTDGTIVQSISAREFGSPNDYDELINTKIADIRNLKPDQLSPYTIRLDTSITKHNRTALTLLCPVYGKSNQSVYGYIYIEIGLSLFSDLLMPYAQVNNLFLIDDEGKSLTQRPNILPADISLSSIGNGIHKFGENSYEFSGNKFPGIGMTLYSCTPFPVMGNDRSHLIYIIVLVLLMALLVGAVLAFLSSYILSLPIQRLNQRLCKITQGDFSFDAEIERPHDEIGAIGHTVNEMSSSFINLLRNTQEMYKQQKNIEIALLQSQVNPHFLYNTLDSIYWMAVIQKNTGIQQMTRSLSNLLKNLAKGTEDHILLQEELSLLNDYISIQAIRYMDAFEMKDMIPQDLYHHRILKFTLQPLIENAIFHGIEPKGICGTIILKGYTQDGFLYIEIEDDGMGIPPDKLKTLLDTPNPVKNKASLNSIGIYNVNKRLQLIYGKDCGLHYESEPGHYTKVTIKIPLED